jgi:hypothetical protein
MSHLRIGSTVRLKKPYGRHTHGLVIGVYGMVSATGLKRTKWVVQFPHSWTKTKTVEVAYEITDFTDWVTS